MVTLKKLSSNSRECRVQRFIVSRLIRIRIFKYLGINASQMAESIDLFECNSCIPKLHNIWYQLAFPKFIKRVVPNLSPAALWDEIWERNKMWRSQIPPHNTTIDYLGTVDSTTQSVLSLETQRCDSGSSGRRRIVIVVFCRVRIIWSNVMWQSLT